MRGIRVQLPGRRRPVRSVGGGRLLMFTALALTAVVTAGVLKEPAHAADPVAATPAEDSAIWNPGKVSYAVDNSGCHTTQTASIDAATPAIADSVAAGLQEDSIKVKNSSDPDVKVVQVKVGQKNGKHIDVTIDGWLSHSACAQTSGTSAQPASFAAGPGAGSVPGAGSAAKARVLGTVDLADHDQIALASASSWFKQALKIAVVAAAFVAISVATLAVIAGIVEAGGTAIAVAARAALAGCIGWTTANLIGWRILYTDAVAATKHRIVVAAAGCFNGAIGGVIALGGGAAAVAGIIRRHLNTTPAILGDSTVGVANQVGVDVTGLSSLVDGVAEGALQAAK